MKECLNCGYERQQKDDEFGIVPLTECPRCGIIYDKITDSGNKAPYASKKYQAQVINKSALQSNSKAPRYVIGAFLVIIVTIAAIQAAPHLGTTAIGKLFFGRSSPSISFTDVDGQSRILPTSGRPAIVGFWIKDCRYCARVMAILNRIRQQYPVEKLDVVAFYLNVIDAPELRDIQFRKGYRMVIAEAQPPVELIASLDKAYGIRGPGRDIYVVDKNGRIRVIDAGNLDKPWEQIESQITEALSKMNL